MVRSLSNAHDALSGGKARSLARLQPLSAVKWCATGLTRNSRAWVIRWWRCDPRPPMRTEQTHPLQECMTPSSASAAPTMCVRRLRPADAQQTRRVFETTVAEAVTRGFP